MEMGFVGRFGKAMHVCVGARSNESAQIPPVLGTCFAMLPLRGKSLLGYARIALLLFDSESQSGREHNREGGVLGRLLYCGLPAKTCFPPV